VSKSESNKIPSSSPITVVFDKTVKEKKRKDSLSIISKKNVLHTKSLVGSKKIESEMEKWNKKNKELEEQTLPVHSTFPLNSAKIPTHTNVSNNSSTISEKTNHQQRETQQQQPQKKQEQLHQDKGVEEQSVATNTNSKLAQVCLVCKRQFNSAEMLEKHKKFSKLHQDNLEKMKQLHTTPNASTLNQGSQMLSPSERR